MSTKTVLVGLGSNQNPLAHLRWALHELKHTASVKVKTVSSIYESDALLLPGAPSAWKQKFLNAVAAIEVLNFDPESFLRILKNIEKKMGRKETAKWAPREIDLDILYVDGVCYKSETLMIPHEGFFQRPFALLPALEVFPQLQGPRPKWSNEWVWPKPFSTQKSFQHFWPKFVGILNITEDSFSDGGQILNEYSFKEKAQSLIQAGADILDIGAESTRPQAQPIAEEVELQRLQSALKWLEELNLNAQVSVDCRSSQVLSKLLEKYPIHFINDVTGFSNPEMARLLASSSALGIAMHSLSVPPKKDETLNPLENPCQQLGQWWQEKIESLKNQSVSEDKIIFDPGIGFGKTPQQNSYILNHLEELADIQSDIFLGFSRKSFLGQYTQAPAAERDTVTALQATKINWAYCQYLRTHDIESQKAALRIC